MLAALALPLAFGLPQTFPSSPQDLTLRFVDTAGEPYASFEITAAWGDPAGCGLGRAIPRTTDGEGRVVFSLPSALGPGSTLLLTLPLGEEFPSDFIWVDGLAGAAGDRTVTLPRPGRVHGAAPGRAGERLDFVLEGPAPRIEGAGPIRGAYSYRTVVVDDDGTFTLDDVWTPEVTVRCADLDFEAELRIAPGGRGSFAVPPENLTLRFVDERGEPHVGLFVRSSWFNVEDYFFHLGHQPRAIPTDGEGRVTLTERSGYERMVSLDVGSDRETLAFQSRIEGLLERSGEVTVVQPRFGRVEGVLRGSEKTEHELLVKTPPFAVEGLDLRESLLHRHVVVDENGAFVLEDVRPGPVVLFTSDGDRMARAAFTLEPGATLRGVELELREATGVAVGRLVDAAGRPVANLALRLGYVDQGPFDPKWREAPRRRVTDADGRFEFSPLPRGRFRLTVEEPGGAEARAQVVFSLLSGRAELFDVVLDERPRGPVRPGFE